MLSDGCRVRLQRRQMGDVSGTMIVRRRSCHGCAVVKRSHRIALKPTLEQESLFGQHAGCARFAYNWALAEFKAGLDLGEWLTHQSLRPRWNRVKGMIVPWGAQLSQNAAKYAIIDFGQAGESWGEYRRRVCNCSP